MQSARRSLIAVLTVLVVALAAGTALASGDLAQPKSSAKKARMAAASSADGLPEKAMNAAMQIDGSMSDGVLGYSFDRTDITDVTLQGIAIKPAFEINGDMDFQPLGGHRAFLNGDLPVTTSAMDKTISTVIANGLTFQAEHQHFYDFSPMVWFIHIRGRGDALTLAKRVHRVLVAADTPLPQSSASHPKTPLDVARIKRILHAYDDEIADDGIVTFFVARRNPVFIDGVRVKPATNIATNVAFEPLNASGSQVAAVPDLGMVTGEVNGVIGTMRRLGWDIGCLYNQETGETPQLYFSHDFKTGDPYALAREIRTGLNRMNSR